MGNTGVSSCEIISGKLGGTISNKRNQNCMFVGGCYESNQDYCWYVKSNCKLGISYLVVRAIIRGMLFFFWSIMNVLGNPFERRLGSNLNGLLLKSTYQLITSAPMIEFPFPTTAKLMNTAIIPKRLKIVKSKS